MRTTHQQPPDTAESARGPAGGRDDPAPPPAHGAPAHGAPAHGAPAYSAAAAQTAATALVQLFVQHFTGTPPERTPPPRPACTCGAPPAATPPPAEGTGRRAAAASR